MSHWFASGLNIAVVVSVVVCFLLTCKFAIRRLERYSITRRLGVVILNVFACFLLLALIFGVSYQTNEALHVVLLTQHSDSQTIEELQHGGESLHWVLLNTQKQDPVDASLSVNVENTHMIESIDVIESVAQLPLLYSQVSQLTILGDGLTDEEWALLNAHYAQMEENRRPAMQNRGYSPRLGLVDMQWPPQLVVEQSGQISGRIQASSALASGLASASASSPLTAAPTTLYRLTLTDPFNRETASILLSDNEAFALPISASVPGQWQYTLTLTERGKPSTRVEEQVAIQVINSSPVKMMIKQSAPSFESKHLQTLVGESAGKVFTLTKISKNKDIRQEINLNAADKTRVNNAFSDQALSFFDLLIIDQLALSELNAQQNTALETAIKGGLGVLVQVQTQQISKWPSDNTSWLRNIQLEPESDPALPAQYLKWDQQQLDIPLSIVNANIRTLNSKIVVSAQNNRPLVVTHEYGQGKVGVSLVNTSYTLKTQGKADLHSHYWQWLFSQISRTPIKLTWQKNAITLPIIATQTQQACVINAAKTTQFDFKQTAITGPINAKEQLLDAGSFCVRYAPQMNGWYTLTARNSQTESTSIAFFAYQQSRWQAWQQSIRYRATQQNIARYSPESTPLLERTVFVQPLLFWAMLLAVLTLLWAERKQSG